MGNSRLKEYNKIKASYLDSILEIQEKYYFNQKQDRTQHIFETEGFLHNSWKISIIDDLKTNSCRSMTWKNEIINALENLACSEVKIQSNIFFHLMNISLKNVEMQNNSINYLDVLGDSKKESLEKLFHLKYEISFEMIENYMKSHESPFYIMESIFSDFVENNFQISQEISENKFESLFQELYQNIQEFLTLLIQAIVRYFNLRYIQSSIFKSLLNELAINHIFNVKVYKTVNQFYIIKNKEQIQQLKNKIKKFGMISLSDLNVNPYFSFDEKFREKFKRKPNYISDKKKAYEYLDETIRIFKLMKNINPPYKKLKQVKLAVVAFELELRKFWKYYEIDSSKLLIAGDILISVFIFLILRSGYSNIIADIEYMRQELSENDLKGQKDYQLSSLSSCVDFIIKELDESLLMELKKMPLSDKKISIVPSLPENQKTITNSKPENTENPNRSVLGLISNNNIIAYDFENPFIAQSPKRNRSLTNIPIPIDDTEKKVLYTHFYSPLRKSAIPVEVHLSPDNYMI